MSDSDRRADAKLAGNTLPPPKALALVTPPTIRAGERLYDRSSLVFPDSVKETARRILLIYTSRLGMGPEKLRNRIMEREDQLVREAELSAHQARTRQTEMNRKTPKEKHRGLEKDDLKHWLAYRSVLGDNKFQYVDRFVRGLDFDELGDEIQALLRSQNEQLLRDALTRFYHVKTFTDLPPLRVFDTLSHSAHGGLFCQLPSPSAPAGAASPEPVLILLFINALIDGFAELHLTATLLPDLDFGQHHSVEEIVRNQPLDPEATLRLYSGYLITTAPPDALAQDHAWGLLILKSPSDPEPFEIRLPSLKAPDAYADMFGAFRIQVHSRTPVRTSFRLRFPNDLNADYEEPRFRPWHRREGTYAPTFANEWYSLDRNPRLVRIGAKFAPGWSK